MNSTPLRSTPKVDSALTRSVSKGDTMIDAGIHSGDTVVVEKNVAANVGDLVIVIVDNEFTLKTLDREGSQFILRPANPAFPVIRPKGQLEIFGVVVGQFRKYK